MESVPGVDALPPEEWRQRRARHESRVDAWVGPYLERRRRGEAHPVEDFLFTYYSQRPAALRRWHPGHGVTLLGWSEAPPEGYVAVAGGVALGPRALASRSTLLATTRRLLAATSGREPNFGCFGMHEWAMVHRLPTGDLRHPAWPLRLGGEGTDAVLESHRVACSHFDAFRFFTESARPLNTLRPGREDRAEFEQPACLHAGMDLYKHAFRLTPLVPSELVADCFALARDIRVLDMRASPYDFSALGLSPVRVETAEGKQEYAAAQRGFTERSRPLRERLITDCDRLLAESPRAPSPSPLSR